MVMDGNESRQDMELLKVETTITECVLLTGGLPKVVDFPPMPKCKPPKTESTGPR